MVRAAVAAARGPESAAPVEMTHCEHPQRSIPAPRPSRHLPLDGPIGATDYRVAPLEPPPEGTRAASDPAEIDPKGRSSPIACPSPREPPIRLARAPTTSGPDPHASI